MHQYVTEYPPAAANAIETVIILEQLEKIFLQLQHTREFFLDKREQFLWIVWRRNSICKMIILFSFIVTRSIHTYTIWRRRRVYMYECTYTYNVYNVYLLIVTYFLLQFFSHSEITDYRVVMYVIVLTTIQYHAVQCMLAIHKHYKWVCMYILWAHNGLVLL